MQLPKEARAKVYDYYFAPSRVTTNPIPLEGKRPNKDIFAKLYSEGSTYRVALLAATKEVNEDAAQILYDHTMRFESTTTVLDFWGQLHQNVRAKVRRVSIKAYVKTTARNALHFLAESPNIVSLYVESGVYTGEDPVRPETHCCSVYVTPLTRCGEKPLIRWPSPMRQVSHDPVSTGKPSTPTQLFGMLLCSCANM